MSLNGKTAIVTGGGTGIGQEISKVLAARGAQIAMASRNPAHLDNARRGFEELGYPVLTFRMDITNKTDVQKVVAGVVEAWGKIDILVNNAGISGLNRLDQEDDSRWYGILATNLSGTYLMTKEVLKFMPDASNGRIINVSSVLGKFGVPGYTAYCTSKHGVIGFTRALALEVVHRGITVNAICPGWVDTAMARQGISESAADQSISPEEFHTQAVDGIPIKRFIQPAEVAELVAYLVSDKAAAITGQAINICGGQTMV